MKKVLVILAFLAIPLSSFSQSIFDKLEDMKGVSSVVVNKDAFELLSKFNTDVKDQAELKVFEMAKELNELKVFLTDQPEISATITNMVSTAVKKKNLTELMRVKDEASQVKIYVSATKNKNFVNEVLMFVNGISQHTEGHSESVVISLTGRIDMNKLSDIADTFTKDVNVKVSKN